MKIKNIVFVLIALISIRGFSQDSLDVFYYPSGKDFKSEIDVSIYRENSKFLYNYYIRNDQKSNQSIWSITLEQTGQISEVIHPDNWRGHIMYKTNRISWYSRNIENNIRPGESIENTKLLSTSIPGIHYIYIQGYFPIPRLESEPDEIIGGNYFENSNRYKTISPKDPPDPFIALAFLDTIASYKHQALDLGWITNQGIANSLNQKLENARKQLEKGKTKQAINMLNAFINEVEAQKDKHLTGEAYALLKYNAEYLIQRLEED